MTLQALPKAIQPRGARTSVAPQSRSISRPWQRPNAYAVLASVPLDKGLHDRTIARKFHPDFAAPLAEVIRELEAKGFRVTIGSGVRAIETQRLAGRTNPYAAKGFHSKHLCGCAADIFHDKSDGKTDAQFYRALHRISRKHGLQPIRGRRERSHIQLPNKIFFAGLKAGRYLIVDAFTRAAAALFGRRHHGHHHSHDHKHHHGRRHHGHRPRGSVVAYQPAFAPG